MLTLAAALQCGTATPPGTLTLRIAVDQFGYLPDMTKMAVISDPQAGFNATASYTPGGTLQVRTWGSNTVVLSGSPSVRISGGTEMPHRPVPPPARCHQPYLYPAGFAQPDHVERPAHCRGDERAQRPGFYLRIRHGLPAPDRRLRHRALGILRHGQVCSFQADLALRSDRQSAARVRDAVERVLTRFRDTELAAHLPAFFRTLSG